MFNVEAFLSAQYDRDEAEVRGRTPFGSSESQRNYQSRHDPARWLRQVNAGRRRLALHSGPHECPTPNSNFGRVDAGEYCATLLADAEVFSDRPGYDAPELEQSENIDAHGSRRDWIKFTAEHMTCGGSWVYFKDLEFPCVACSCRKDEVPLYGVTKWLYFWLDHGNCGRDWIYIRGPEFSCVICSCRKDVTHSNVVMWQKRNLERHQKDMEKLQENQHSLVCMGHSRHDWMKYAADGTPLCKWPCLRCGKVRRGKHPGH